MLLTDDHSIERLALGVIDRSLAKRDWTHEGHFAATLWLLRHRPELTAADEMRMLITRYNEVTHTPNTDTGGYHHTITRASIRAAANHMNGLPRDTPLHACLTSLMATSLGSPGWLLAYWHRDTLFSVRARREWVEPDLAALPW